MYYNERKSVAKMHWLYISLFILLLLAGCIFIINRNKRLVNNYSVRYKELIILNNKTTFHTIQGCYQYTYTCISRAEFNKLTFEKYLYSLIDEDQKFFKHIIDAAKANKNKYAIYAKKAEAIKTQITVETCKELHIPYKLFIKYENALFNNALLNKPICDVSIHCKIIYTTPTGRTTSWHENTFTFAQLIAEYDKVINSTRDKEIRKYHIQREREMMSDGVRYDILKRDGFRCQICGSTAQDGVKLHVDHIIPISKGGHTTPDNLRTLCDRCNLGKGDKIE